LNNKLALKEKELHGAKELVTIAADAISYAQTIEVFYLIT
jgi:hypothetical protein